STKKTCREEAELAVHEETDSQLERNAACAPPDLRPTHRTRHSDLLSTHAVGRYRSTATMDPSNRKDATVLALKNSGMRRGCSECARKKKKCDGLTPCSRCLQSGVRCTYSKRKWHQGQPGHQQEPQHNPRGPAVMQSTDSSSGAFLASGMLPLKSRFRLGASPATGLVGMQENAFLSDYFGCVGILPLTTPSHIRGAMVKMMTGPIAQKRLGALDDYPEQGRFGTVFTEDGITAGNQAWAILGYFHGFMRDMANCVAYLNLSGSFLIDSIKQGSSDMLPAGFAEVLRLKDTVPVYSGHLDAAGIESLGAQRPDAPQIKPVACEGDIYRYVAQSLTAFEQVVFERACENSATRRHLGDDEPCEDDKCGATPHGNAPQAEEVADAMVAGLKDGLVDFEHLQESADRPNIRTSVCGLLINITLANQKAAKGDAGGALEKFGHCVEMFERYPGVCSSMMHWCHLVHNILGALAAIDDSRAWGLYTRLREAYNPFRPSSSLPAPPLEEWRGISAFCHDFQCRIYECIIASQAFSVFSTPSLRASKCAGSQGTQRTEENLHAADKEYTSSIVSAGVTLEDATGSIMVASRRNTDKPMACASSWESHQEPVPQMSPPVGLSLSPSHLHLESVRRGTSDSGVFSGAVEGYGGGRVIADLVRQVPGMPLTPPGLREVDGATHGDNAIAAADWLEIAQAMMDADDDKTPALPF
ncbi:unnamed protein product, partial [Ectocarpus fasciculatus]